MKLIVAAITAVLFWMLQDWFYHRFWSRNLSVSLTFGQAFVTEGETAVLTEIITNAKSLPLPVLHVKFQMDKHLVYTASGNSSITDQNYRSDVFSCMPWQEIRRSLEFRCERRGYYRICQLNLSSYDLFLSSHFAAMIPTDTSMYVYPGPADPIRLELPLRDLMGQILANRSLIRDPFEMQSIRPYQSYDPYRNVNWKATARTGNLKVNVYTPTASWQVLCLLDVDSDRLWRDEDLTEEAIRLCGTYACRLMEEGIPVSVCTNGMDCLTGRPGYVAAGAGASHARSLLEMLSRIQVEAKISRPSMEEILEQQADAAFDGGGSPNQLYLLLSPKQRPSLVQAYEPLCRLAPGSQWILPLRPDDALRIDVPASITLYQWEVSYDRS